MNPQLLPTKVKYPSL